MDSDFEILCSLLDEIEIDKADLSELILEGKEIKKLNLSRCNIINGLFVGAKIDSLDLNSCKLPEKPLEEIGKIKGLKEFRFVGNSILNENLMFKDFPDFKEFDPQKQFSIIMDEKYRIKDKLNLDGLENAKDLENLCIESFQIERKEFEKLKSLKKLTKLKIRESEIDKDAIIPKMDTLKSLDILSRLDNLEIIKNLTNVEKLSLNLIENEKIEASILKEFNSLKDLDLNGISETYENLPEAPDLKKLSICSCKINEIKKISSMYPHLEYLNISDNPLENVTVEDIINIRNKMKNSEFRISFDNSKLAEKLKQTKIEFEDEELMKDLNEFIFTFSKDREITLFDIVEANIYYGKNIDNAKLFNKIMELKEKGLHLPNSLKLKVDQIDDVKEEYLEEISKYVKKIEFGTLKGITKEKLEKIGYNIGYEIKDDLRTEISKSGNYSFEEILQLVNIMEQIKSKIPKDADEYNKFKMIYEIIAKAADYDSSGCIGNDEYIDGAEELTRSLHGVLVEGRAVCAGYALAIEQCSKYNDIDARYVSGCAYGDPNKGHAWNQVCIDGKWYNADATWDRKAIQRGEKTEYFLVGDEVFYKDHTVDSKKDVHECKKDYEQIEMDYIPQKTEKYSEKYGKGIETLFSTDEFREVAENTTIKEGLIEKIKSAQKEQQENNLQNGER